MKELKVILVVLLIGLPIFTIYRWTEIQAPEWNQQARIHSEIQQAVAPTVAAQQIERVQLWTVFYMAFMVVIIIGIFVAMFVIAWKVYDQRKESWARMAGGSFALQTFDNGQVRWQVDPNKQMTGTTGFMKATGALGEFSSAAGHDRQLMNNLAIQRTRTANAALDNIRNSAQAKLAAGYYDRHDAPKLPMFDDEVEAVPVATWQVLDAKQAFEQSTQSEWILGQNKLTGAVYKFAPRESFGIVGSPGVGKTTYAGQLVMALALKSGYRVIVLDGKGGADFSRFAPWTEYASIDYTNVMCYLDVLTAEMHRRQAILNQYNANSIWELRGKDVAIPKPILCLADEFGAVAAGVKATSREAYKNFERAIGDLLRLGRSAGIFMAFCDQNPSAWCSTMRGVLTTNICFRLGGAVGNAVSEYNLHELDRVGEFQVSGERYSGFPTWQVIDQLLPVDYRKPRALLTVDSTAVTTVTSNEAGGYITDQNSPKIPPQSFTSKSGNTGVTTTDNSSNEGDKTDNVISNVTSVFTISGAAVTTQEKQEVYRIYLALGKRKNATAKAIWGGTGGYLRYLNAVIAEYEPGEKLQ